MDALVDAASPMWSQLWALTSRLREMDPIELVRVQGGGRDEKGVIDMPWIDYDPIIYVIEKLLYELKVIQGLDWGEWLSDRGLENAMALTSVESGSLLDTVSMMTAIFRSERFGSGAIAETLRNGALLALLDRLRRLVES